MPGSKQPDGLPLALLVDDREQRTHWLGRVLEEGGFAVLRERTGRDARERVRTAQPDLIVVGGDLPDITGLELCRSLRADLRVTSSTPIFLTMEGPATRDQRLEALRSGAWECIAPPHDPGEILLRANAYVHAKRDVDRTRAEGLLDPSTGLYNRQGLARRARELGSQAFREHGAIACVVLALDLDAAGVPIGEEGAVARTVQALQSASRRSDAIGRLGALEFAVLAPGTDGGGARRLAERLAGSLQRAALDAGDASGATVRIRCGYDAVGNVGYAPMEPVELLVRASAALRTGRSEGGGWIRRFEESGPAAAPPLPPSPHAP